MSERAVASARWIVIVASVAGLISAPLWVDRGNMRLIVEFCYLLALAQAWNLLAGYAGLVSVGQQAFVGIGSYAFLTATVFGGLPPLVALALAGVVAALAAIPSAVLMFRLQGAYFSIGTWALAEVLRLVFTQIKVFGAGTGLSLPISIVQQVSADRGTRDLVIYYLGLGLGLGSVLMVFLLLRSRTGLALTAVRDSEAAASSIGINRWRLRLAVYTIAAAVAGWVGALILLQKLRLTPASAFNVLDWSANIIFIVVIGGIGTIEGPIIGTIVFIALRLLLADYGTWYLIALGLIAIVVMIKAPNGLWGLIAARFDIHLFPIRRRAPPSDVPAKRDQGKPTEPDAGSRP